MKTRILFSAILAGALTYSCGHRMNKVEREVIVYHHTDTDTVHSGFEAQDLVPGQMSVGNNVGNSRGTRYPRAAERRQASEAVETRTRATRTYGPVNANGTGAGSGNEMSYEYSPVNAEIGSDAYKNRHTPVRTYEHTQSGTTGSSATQAAGTGTSAGRRVN